jgi:hypothetical protein
VHGLCCVPCFGSIFSVDQDHQMLDQLTYSLGGWACVIKPLHREAPVVEADDVTVVRRTIVVYYKLRHIVALQLNKTKASKME